MLISAPDHQPISRRSSSAKRGRGTSRRLVEGAPLAQNLPPSSPPKAGAQPELSPQSPVGGRDPGMGPGFRREGARGDGRDEQMVLYRSPHPPAPSLHREGSEMRKGAPTNRSRGYFFGCIGVYLHICSMCSCPSYLLLMVIPSEISVEPDSNGARSFARPSRQL